MVMLSREVQLWNAHQPITVTLLGMSMLSREVQPLNASSPISVTPSGITHIPSSLISNLLSIRFFLFAKLSFSFIPYNDYIVFLWMNHPTPSFSYPRHPTAFPDCFSCLPTYMKLTFSVLTIRGSYKAEDR